MPTLRSSTTYGHPWIRYLWMAGLVLLVLAVMILLLELLFGGVAGAEFAPDRFERRLFYFHQIPWFELQVTPVQRNSISNDLEDHLRRQRLIAPVPARRWDVVTVRSGATLTEGQAQILCRYLDEQDKQGKLRWLEWTHERPDCALPFWAAVQQAAQLEAYYIMPDLFDFAAAAADDDDVFRQQLDQLLTRLYAELGDDYRALERHGLAARCYAAALERNRDDPTLRQKQADVQRLLEAAPQPAKRERAASD